MLDVSVDESVIDTLPKAWLRQLRVEVGRMVRAAAKHEGRRDLEVALRLTDDSEIHALNRGYRAKDKPTDVLAFAQREGVGGSLQPQVLGDIVISLETAKRQAKRRGPAGLFAETRFLASHGLCHLLGYDHRNDAEEATMNARMAELLREAARRGSIRAA